MDRKSARQIHAKRRYRAQPSTVNAPTPRLEPVGPLDHDHDPAAVLEALALHLRGQGPPLAPTVAVDLASALETVLADGVSLDEALGLAPATGQRSWLHRRT